MLLLCGAGLLRCHDLQEQASVSPPAPMCLSADAQNGGWVLQQHGEVSKQMHKLHASIADLQTAKETVTQQVKLQEVELKVSAALRLVVCSLGSRCWCCRRQRGREVEGPPIARPLVFAASSICSPLRSVRCYVALRWLKPSGSLTMSYSLDRAASCCFLLDSSPPRQLPCQSNLS